MMLWNRPLLVDSLRYRLALGTGAFLLGMWFAETGFSQETQQRTPLEKALRFRPTQPVEIDIPTAEEAAKCTITEADTSMSKPGWIVSDGSGRMIRRFLDTNEDSSLDQLGYYRNGIEVYRDIDSDFDKKFDQMRWLGPAGSRWGLDPNQDGKIDSWKTISAEEVSFEIVEAIKARDAGRFQALMIQDEEIDRLQLGATHEKEVRERAQAAAARFAEFAQTQQLIDPDSTWVHFGGLRPGVIPAGTDGAGQDVLIYDSVTAVVATADKRHGQLSIGTLVRTGEAWRVVDLPELIVEGQPIANGGLFYQLVPSLASADAGGVEHATEEEQQLFAEYEEVESRLKAAKPADLPALHRRRGELYLKMAMASKRAEDRSNWIRQMADMVGSAYRNGEFPEGNEFLVATVRTLVNEKADPADVAYTEYRRLTNHNSIQLEKADPGDYEELQKEHLESLRSFVRTYPDAEASADAMLQIGLQEEFEGNTDEAKTWYQAIVRDFPESTVARKARGAALRLDSEGKSIPFTGTTLDGKKFDLAARPGRVVLLQYWATWCEPCKEDLKLIKQLYEKYRDRNFEVVSISLDNSAEEVRAYLKTENLPWVHLFEEGGLDSPLADQLGVSVVPTMILVGADGKVVSRNVASADLDRVLSRQFRTGADDDEKKKDE